MSDAKDTMYGNQLPNEMYGREDGDSMYGDDDANNFMASNDIIYGNEGNDWIFGDNYLINSRIGGNEFKLMTILQLEDQIILKVVW